MVVHPTTYDGCLELAALQLGHVASGTSWDETCYKTSKEVVKTHLLQDYGWFQWALPDLVQDSYGLFRWD